MCTCLWIEQVPKAVSVGPGIGRHVVREGSRINGLKSRSKTFAYGTNTSTSHNFSCKVQ